jgi:hypothetical protein
VLEDHHSRKTLHNWVEGLIIITALIVNGLLPFADSCVYGCLLYGEGQRERMTNILAADQSGHPAQIARANELAKADPKSRGLPAAQFTKSMVLLKQYNFWNSAGGAPDLPRLTTAALATLDVPFLDAAFQLSRRLFTASPSAHDYVTVDRAHPKNAVEGTLFSRYGVGFNMVDLVDLIPSIGNTPNFTMDGLRQAGHSDP